MASCTTAPLPVMGKATAPVINTRGRVIGETSSKWAAELTNYQIDYTPKAILLRHKRPSSSNRKNKPHPTQVAHLRRLANEPVCTVKTIINPSDKAATSRSLMQRSLMKEEFKLPPALLHTRTTRFGCNKNKQVAASGIVPTPKVITEKEEPLLPACAKNTTLMTTSNPFQYVPRKRRISPKVLDETFNIIQPLPDKIPIGKPRPPHRTSRRLVSSAPTATLQVSSFDGGAPPDYSRSITGRRRCWRPAIPGGILNVPGYMQQF